ncbi:hypothetical protein M9H77_06979 [Catharanthus roseus]|uniref:Uncharacterized protein n=1 Tax=Catharanthus roseus TaxID=4058 RepID=A0ACC0BTU5_CATRO|nr:hypothetical protein M9H77_06979 [Catharanthus roseus]
MLGRFTLNLDPVDKGRSIVGGLGPRQYYVLLHIMLSVVCAVVYEKSNVCTVYFGFQDANVGPLDSLILGSSTSSNKVLIYKDLGPHGLQPTAERHAGTLPSCS